ncbi:hypothetical protein RclHR1_07360012 [Rhizophagus clarus]|uniref:Uncharacterized protein n=1 Tax=Rhizophagus clarus TaxID=94130 RepID=A0A2Z6SLA0_9GLOM|nr:hypothetical protein RclHR1_07360012 [Rhizophagus clarus]GES85062.1 hypothetical protein GLOIN_2v1586536 [Rhizophagus clarus]
MIMSSNLYHIRKLLVTLFCLFCENYDLYQDCKSKSPNVHDNNHAFQPIAYSGLSLFGITLGRNATCDYCKLTCTGNKCYKCANGEFPVEEYELFQVKKDEI